MVISVVALQRDAGLALFGPIAIASVASVGDVVVVVVAKGSGAVFKDRR